MILKKCHVENYGKLQQFDYDFNDNLNIILHENGWGKTTFASFIKAMLFGLPQTTKQDLDENERKKYTPWQGGIFGGWLEFELDNKNYRIERFFAEKQSKDKFALYDLSTNQLINEPDFVQKKLGINANTFMRSTFIQHNYTSPNDESIKEKLGKLIENQDLNSLADVDKKLLTYQTNLELLRGKGGKIYQLQTNLDDVLNKKEICKNAKIEQEKLDGIYKDNLNKLNIINEKLNKLRAQIQNINDERTKSVIIKQSQEKQNELQRIQSERQAIIDFFKNSIPTQDLIDDLAEKQNELARNQSTLEELNINRESQNFEKLQNYFNNNIPTENDITEAKNNLEKYNNIQNKIQFSQNIFNQSKSKINTINKCLIIGFGILAFIICLVGIIAFTGNLPIMLTFIVIGVILGALSIYFAIKPIKNNHLPANMASKKNLENLQKEQDEYKLKIVSFVEKYKENTDDLNQSLNNISYNLRQYHDYKLSQENLAERKQKIQEKIQQIKSNLIQYYSQYFNNPEFFNSCLTECRSKYERFNYITQNYEQKQKELDLFISQHNINEHENIHIDLNLEPLQNEVETLEQEKELLAKTNSEINSKLINLSNLSQNLSGIEATEESLKEEISKLKKDLNTIKLTRTFLEQSKNNLTAKYLAPLTDTFKSYSQQIVGEKFDKISIDTSLNVLIEHHGEKKTSKFYSSGGRDVIELCMRLALAKTLFDNETPPLIMDDPFNNLDDEKTQKGLDLLNQISKEFQIIYLVCHSSRTQK